MKRSFKRVLCLLISLLTVLPMLPISQIISYADTEVYLTELHYDSVTTVDGELRFDSDITIGTETYEKGIYMHPPGVGDAAAASIVYNIKGGNYTKFSVWVGKDSAGNGWGNNPIRFEIYIDGTLAAASGNIQYPDKEKLEITIPSDAKSLKLVAKATGDAHYSCGATFAEPILRKRDARITELTIEKSLTELDFADVQCLFGVSDPMTTVKEGELRIDNNIVIGTTAYDKGIYLHPMSSEGSAYITYDISDMGFQTFRTYVGKDNNGNDWGNNKVQFEIYVDGILSASSKALQYPAVEELFVDIPVDAKELKLVAKALGNYSATGCCFGNPVFTVSAKPGELMVSNKPDASIPNPVGEYTFKGMAYADQVEIWVDGVKRGANAPDSKGNWSITVDFKEKINHVIQIKSVVDGVVIQTEMFNYLMNDDVIYASALTVKSWTGLKDPQVYAVNADMSVGGNGRYRTAYGFQNHPLSGKANNYGAADINIDIEGLGYTYFQTIVGKDDAVAQGGTGVEFIVLVDGVIMARSGNMVSYEAANLCCEIPEDAKILTLRITNYDGDYFYSTGDWCDPMLARKKDDLYSNLAPAYDASAKKESVDLSDGAVMHFETTGGTKAITIPYNSSMKGKLTVELYKFTGSYFSTLKRDPVEKAILGESTNDQTLIFTKVLDPGAYLLVIKGEGTLDTYVSDTTVMYSGREFSKYALPVTIAYEETAEAPFLKKVQGSVGDDDAAATVPDDKEKEAAKAVYDAYLADDLKNFPVIMTIGEKNYTGFGDKHFALISQKTAENDKNGVETVTVFEYTPDEADKAPITFTVTSVYYPAHAAYDWVIYFTNNDAERETPIVSNIKSVVTFKGEDPYVYGYSGDPTGFLPVNFAVTDYKRVFAPEDGRSTNYAFPYWNMEYGNGGALIAVGWAGQWEASFQKTGNRQDTVTTFINGQQTFRAYLKPGETARTPITAIVQYNGRDTDRAVNLWRRYMIDCNMPKVEVEESKQKIDPMILGTTHEYFNEMTGTNEKEQLQALAHFLQSGADLDIWWMDAGWYYSENGTTGIGSSWWSTGSWLMDTQRFPTSLKVITELAKKYGVETMLWFEPERVGNKNALKKDGSTLHPDWVFSSGLVDFSNEECVDWLIERIISILEASGSSIYREDFNMGPLATWNSVNSNDPDRAGLTENQHIQGHFRLWAAIAEHFPNMILDSCASGGRRNDLESMRYAVPLHRTDQGYGDSPLQQCYTYAMAAWIPYFGSKADSDVPDSSVYRTQYSDKYALRRALVPSMEYNYSPYDPIDWYKVQDVGAEQRIVSRYYYADFYRLTGYTRDESDWMAWEYYTPEEGHGYANIWRRCEAEPTTRIFLKGLDADAVYDVWFEDRNSHAQYTGGELMYTGIEVTLPSYRSNDLMYFSIVGNQYAPYTERELSVQVTEPSISTYGGQLGAPVHEVTLDGVVYYASALRFNMSVRDTVLSLPIGKGEGYIEKGVEADYAALITVNGRKLSDLMEEDESSVKMDYDVYNNVITLYLKKGNSAGFAPNADNTITLDSSIATFEGVSLGAKVTYSIAGNDDAKWTLSEKTPVGSDDDTKVSVVLNTNTMKLKVGQTGKLNAEILPADKTVVWTSSDERVVTVASDGTVTAVGSGTATVTVTVEGSDVSAECTVTVTENSSSPAKGNKTALYLTLATIIAATIIATVCVIIIKRRKRTA